MSVDGIDIEQLSALRESVLQSWQERAKAPEAILNSASKLAELNPKYTSESQAAQIYAKKGEPIYQKDMDLDSDGVISFDEFKEYCDENNISVYDQKQMLKARIKWHMLKQTTEDSIEAIREIEPKAEIFYAKKDDSIYDEEMDFDDDGIISYNEYLRYCEENSDPIFKETTSSKTVMKKEPSNNDTDISGSSTRIINIGKALNAYTSSSVKPPEVKAEATA